MKSALMCFDFEQSAIRTIEIGSESWFVARDICNILELGDVSQAVRPIPGEEKGTYEIRTLGGIQEMLVVSEAGLYQLVFRSNKPEARRFAYWVFREVLPQIRKTGNYFGSEYDKAKSKTIQHLQAENRALTNRMLALENASAAALPEPQYFTLREACKRLGLPSPNREQRSEWAKLLRGKGVKSRVFVTSYGNQVPTWPISEIEKLIAPNKFQVVK